jgi:sugar/nucleoside kinase (ribokinase family)
MRAEDVSQESVTSGRVLLVDCVETEAATTAVRFARAAGIPTVIDVESVRPNIDALLSEVDIIIAAQAFPSAYTGYPDLGQAVRELAKRFRACLVVATLGEQGSLAVVGKREITTSGFSVQVTDTTGAGDAFRGGFVSAWLESKGNGDVSDLLVYANAVAALNCRSLGAGGGLPNKVEVERLLATVL